MRSHQRWSRLRYGAVVAVACFLSCNGEDPAALPTADTGSNSDATLAPGCAFSTDFACYVCGGATAGKDYQVGCRGQDDCAQFCGPLPSGWQFCNYTGPGYSPGSLCDAWPWPPRGTLAGCTAGPNTDVPGGIAYLCPFCPGGGLKKMTPAIPTGGSSCTWFFDTCVPEGYQAVSADRCQ